MDVSMRWVVLLLFLLLPPAAALAADSRDASLQRLMHALA